MHVHVLGVGALGTLVATHLRASVRQRLMQVSRSRVSRWLVPQHVAPYLPDPARTSLTLHMRDRPMMMPAQGTSFHLSVERDGVPMTEHGFQLELVSPVDPAQPRLLVPDADGVPREAPGVPPAPIDSLIVATKADATLAALRPLITRITPATTVVVLQNGMGVLDQLIERLWPRPEHRPHFILASTTHGCYLKRPLHTVHAGFGSVYLGVVPGTHGAVERPLPSSSNTMDPELDLAAIPDTHATYSLRSTLALLLSLPLDVRWERIRMFQLRALRKLIVNACINPTTALVDCKNGELFGASSALELFRALCTEASQVLEAHARDAKAAQTSSEADVAHLSSLPLADLLTQTDADGLPLLDASLQPASMLHEVENVVRATATNWSSMHQDIRSRRGRTEIDYINGYLGELGRAYGIPTPANDLLTHLVKLKAQRTTGSWQVPSM
ncbi:unnamed protein product [Malassezia sympodialis ATCC 42132]|uniref:2-dehydropantoate 2-reductase n=1 Tax=Malassezia sympodialis (strain ATCC 42132) TaxID=1230383 RepID=M5E9H8_MALS4|nr:uncharacterized protein MSY001_2083 [Malassezia sympodialis ATCC 42132]CCU99377.1 unnamed protein product [Malassezia sympodialis ATCC 42132]SHO78683.1 Similar to S.cerevisiae protein PAN5 (2-dehydropantoate 2-reductase) [Malassezia sympodialis ATCC 42132]|eukprot:XP_018740630.1 uncharacterized protein MSY001_2083 [Malassezia sympodialis ATCC 42132]